ncbi:MAG: hypothetical protein ACLQGP_09620 [Isosphaeraceae bacterium]
MPKGSGVRFTILVEDRALERFVRHCLLELGAYPKEIRVLPFPAGRGSGKQWIDREYPIQVRAYRRRAFENIALVVGTDADEQAVQQRAQRLADTLRDAGCVERTVQERIAIWIPKWNIETWLLFLKGEDVHEGINYKMQVGEVNFEAAAREFADRFRQRSREPEAANHLPSLVLVFGETRRIQKALDRAST